MAAEEEIDLLLLDVDIAADIHFPALFQACPYVAVVAGLAVLLEDDGEDAAGAAGGVVFGDGVGDDLDALDGVGGDLVEGEGSGPSVHENSGGGVAEGHVAVDVP